MRVTSVVNVAVKLTLSSTEMSLPTESNLEAVQFGSTLLGSGRLRDHLGVGLDAAREKP